MKPLHTLLATVGLSLLIAGTAGAQGWGRRGHEGGGGGGRREAYAPAPRGPERMAPPPYAGRPGPAPRGDFAPRAYARPTYPAYPSYAPSSRAWGRGQFLPRNYWAGDAVDPRRYRLRTPPPGYGWYGVGRDAYLVQRSTGLILDTAPGAW